MLYQLSYVRARPRLAPQGSDLTPSQSAGGMALVSPSTAPSVTDATTEFFRGLQQRGHEPALEKTTGTLRFDLSDGGKRPTRWAVDIRRGDLSISHRNAKADCVLKADHALFDGVVRGEINPIAALLRGAMSAEGDMRLLIGFQRLFADPPRPS
jgi:putative sterol carrier protein